MAPTLPSMAKNGPPKLAAQVWEDRPGDGRRNAARAANSVQVATIKGFHLGRDDGEGILHREVAGIEPMHFRARQHFQKGLSALLGEEDVGLPPEDDGLRLPLLQEGLPLRIKA